MGKLRQYKLPGTVCENLDNKDGDLLLHWRYECFRYGAGVEHVNHSKT